MTEPDGAAGLRVADFSRLPPPPFHRAIRISQAVAWFEGRLYVGGGRGPHRGGGSDEEDRSLGAQIARLDPATGVWDLLHDSPCDDDGVARDRSVRAFAVHRGALVAALGSLRGQVRLLRSTDGDAFVEYGAPGLGQGDADIAAVRSLVSLGGRLYTAPVGMNNGRGWADDNVAAMPVVLACDDPATDAWQAVSEPSFGDEGNESVNELAAFAGTLWAATLNRRSGFQLWRAEGLDGEAPTWTKILDRGAWRGPASPVPASLAAFGDALYVGTGVQRQPQEGADRYGPIAPELIRVRADGAWDLVAGETRFTPDGLKAPVSGRGAGFGDPFVQAFWRMAEHEGVLYVGGSDWRFWPTYLPRGPRGRADLSAVTVEWLRAETEAWRGDYGLWHSADGAAWSAVTTIGLGDSPSQYGLRELLSTPHGLIAVPAAKGGDAPGSGIEIWQGARVPA